MNQYDIFYFAFIQDRFYITLNCFQASSFSTKYFRTDFPCNYHNVGSHLLLSAKLFTQPCCKLYHALISCLVELSGLIRMTALNGHRIKIPCIGRISNLPGWYALYDFPVQSYYKITACLRNVTVLQSLKIVSVLHRCRTRIGSVMNDYSGNLIGWKSRSWIFISQLTVLHQYPAFGHWSLHQKAHCMLSVQRFLFHWSS